MLDLKLLHSVVQVDNKEAQDFYRQAKLKLDLSRQDTTSYMVFVDGQPIGACVIVHEAQLKRWLLPRQGDVVSSVLVLPEYRGRGYAKALLSHVLAQHPDLYLSVNVDNYNAILLYTNLGFIPVKTLNLNSTERIIMHYSAEGLTGALAKQVELSFAQHVATITDEMTRGFGYVSVKLDLDQAVELHKFLTGLGFRNLIEPHKFHVTLMYDESNPLKVPGASKQDHRATITGYDVLGELTSKWRAVVLNLDSESLVARHEELKTFGFEHSYPDFIAHLSVKYRPTLREIELLETHLDTIQDMFARGLILNNERWEPVKGD